MVPSVPGRRPEQTAAAFDLAAREVGVPYAFIGGMAVNAWGQPRATEDVDCLIDLSPHLIASFADALQQRRLAARASDFEAARKDLSHVTVHDDLGNFRVDCKLALTALEKEQVREAVEVPISTGVLRVVRPEETVAFKVKFGSPRDLQDALSIVRAQRGKIDEERLLAFALRLGVAEQVRDLLKKQ